MSVIPWRRGWIIRIWKNPIFSQNLSSSAENLTSDDSINFNDISNIIDKSRNIPVEINEIPNLRLVLAQWALRHNITHVAVNDLLKNLKQFPLFSELPSDARTLLKTNTTYCYSKNYWRWCYHYFGIKREVVFLVDSGLNLPTVLLLIAGIDGHPITSNPPSQLWPILGYFSNINSVTPSVFIIGVFYGKNKPENSNEYLRNFVYELKKCSDNQNNIIKEQHISIKLHALTCDAPAKSFVLSCKGHTGNNSCVRCTCNGLWLDGRAFFHRFKCWITNTW